MPSVFALIGGAWRFSAKQPAVFPVAFWLIFSPLAIAFSNVLPRLCILALALMILWGEVALLVIGKRLLQTKAGRSRTSLRTTVLQARRYIIPAVLTGLLRIGLSLLWALLLIVPGILYAIRTSFFLIVIVTEGIEYRAGLKRSQHIVRGRTLQILLTFLILGITLFAPAMIVRAFLTSTFHDVAWSMIVIATVTALLSTVGMVLFTFAMILLYCELLPSNKVRVHTK